MNLLMLILIFLGVATGAAVFYAAWRLSSDEAEKAITSSAENEEAGDAKE
jgi:flagellar basal body-associated protein FliL